MTARLFSFVFIIGLVCAACSSGKKAYKRGDYYSAVVQAVRRLQSNPEHKTSRQVLEDSYHLAIQNIEGDIQNTIQADAPQKWKSVLEKYGQINSLYELIRSSPAALGIIRNPVNRYDEVGKVKVKAADESYELGVQSLMRTSRDDAKKAYFLFKESDALSPGYKESIEMMEKAREVATIKISVQDANAPTVWNFEPILFSAVTDIFIKFFKRGELESKSITPDQTLDVSPVRFSIAYPEYAQNKKEYTDSVVVEEKVVNNIKRVIKKPISGSVIYYTKAVKGNGLMSLSIVGNNQVSLLYRDIQATPYWQCSWAICNGDKRALPKDALSLCEKRETNPPDNYLFNMAKKDLTNQVAQQLRNFYSRY